MKILARIRRWFYLVFCGMWRGERAGEICGNEGVSLITGKGSFLENTWKTTKVFYGPTYKDRPWV
jgi:hypothetical protein